MNGLDKKIESSSKQDHNENEGNLLKEGDLVEGMVEEADLLKKLDEESNCNTNAQDVDQEFMFKMH